MLNSQYVVQIIDKSVREWA